MVEMDQEARRVLLVLRLNHSDVLFWRPIRCVCREHDGRAMGIVGAYVTAVVPARPLKTHPDVRLGLLEHRSEVEGRIGIG